MKVWQVVIILLSALGWQRSTTGAEQTNLDLLVKLYRDYGMPLPAKGARLVEYSYPGISIVNGVEQKPKAHLASLVKDEEKSLLLLAGPLLKSVAKEEIVWKFRPPNEVKSEAIEIESFELSVFEVNTRLAFALQLQALGEKSLATAFFAGSLSQDCGHHFSTFYQPAGLRPEKAVAYLAWSWLANRLLDADSSRDQVLQVARKVFKAAPELENERSKA